MNIKEIKNKFTKHFIVISFEYEDKIYEYHSEIWNNDNYITNMWCDDKLFPTLKPKIKKKFKTELRLKVDEICNQMRKNAIR